MRSSRRTTKYSFLEEAPPPTATPRPDTARVLASSGPPPESSGAATNRERLAALRLARYAQQDVAYGTTVAEVEKIEVAGNASLENEATIDETLNLAEPSADIAPVPVPLTVGLNKQQTAAAKRSWRVDLGQISAPPTALEGGEAPAEEGSPPPAGVSTAFFRERTTERGAVPAAALDGASAADYNMQMKLLRSARRGPASAACGAMLAPYALGERTGLNSTYNTHGEPLYGHSTVNGTDTNGSVLPYATEVPPGGPIVPSAAGGDENALPAGASFHGAPPTAGLDRGTKLARMQQVAGSPAGTAAPFGY